MSDTGLAEELSKTYLRFNTRAVKDNALIMLGIKK